MKLALSYNDVLLVPQLSTISSRSEVDLSTVICPNLSLKVPLISASMSSVTNTQVAKIMSKYGAIGMLPRFEKFLIQAEKVYEIKKNKEKVIAAIGIKEDYIEHSKILLKARVDAVTLDIAHAHNTNVLEAISKFKNIFGNIPLIVGTVATYEGARDLFHSGADTVRVGIGAGTICTTRIVAGSGVPQITAITDAVRAKKKFKNKYILADGGAANSGDIVKALACGADGVICGSLFAAADEAPGELIEINNATYKRYDASTSLAAKTKQVQSEGTRKNMDFFMHIEGVESLVKSNGKLNNILDHLVAGISSGLSYSGAHNIPELWKKAKFVQITEKGYQESLPHDTKPFKLD